MPTILAVKAQDNQGPEDYPGRWRRGQIVTSYPQNATLGYGEIPLNNIGEFSVSQINNYALPPPIYGTFTLTDSGTITKGASPVDVVAGDVITWRPYFFPNGEVDPDGWFFRNEGQIEIPLPSIYQIRITDKTDEEVSQYLESFGKKVSYTSLQYDPNTDMRRVRVTNDYLTVSGNNGFTDEGTQAVVDEWSGTRVSWSPSQFVMDAVLPSSSYSDFQISVQRIALDDLYLRRRWYITAQGMTALENNNGVISGTKEFKTGFGSFCPRQTRNYSLECNKPSIYKKSQLDRCYQVSLFILKA